MGPMYIEQTLALGIDREASIRGRVVFVRSFGKLTFVVLRDAYAEIQVGLRGKIDPPKMWSIISVEGTTGFTQKGEFTLWSESYTTLAECHGDMPSKFHGIHDPEAVHHNRAAHLIANRDKARILVERSRMVSRIRMFLECLDYHEIETPILSDIPSGATAKAFETRHNAEGRTKYLRIATEIPLKMAIVAGFERVYEIGKIFRNEGLDRTHRPEFTSVELYETCQTLEGMMERFKYLVDFVARDIAERAAIRDDYELAQRAVEVSRQSQDVPVYEYDDLVAEHGEDFDRHLTRLCFVIGQPLEQTPLCKARADGKADRFEVFGNGFEIANAFQEVNTAAEQLERFERMPEELRDQNFLRALSYGMPETAGMGIGIDRLVMYLTDTENVRDVQVFP